MVRELMKDTVFLAQKAQPATADDIPTADDLLDTLRAHADGCVGMAANMIGVNKAIIVFDDDAAHQGRDGGVRFQEQLHLHRPERKVR